jgi:hypothetical protein
MCPSAAVEGLAAFLLVSSACGARSTSLLIPTSNTQPLSLSSGRLDWQNKVRWSSQNVKRDHTVVLGLNLGEAAILVNHVQQPSKISMPSLRQIDHQGELTAPIVVRMRA